MVKYEKTEKYTKPKDLREFLLLALQREKASIRFYAEMAKHSFSPDIKELIIGLKNEEISHKDKIESKLNEFDEKMS